MSSSSSTLDQLWQTLGLDSLPPDAGSAENLGSTRVPDWDERTAPNGPRVALPPLTERIDLPRISMLPPAVDAQPHE